MTMRPFEITRPLAMVDMTELLGNSREYAVPPFQRSYSWGEEEWEELWEDIGQMARTGGQHYMGCIVLQKSEARDDNVRYTIIDGQQRIVTLSVFALAVISLLDGPAETGSLFQFRETDQDSAAHDARLRQEQLAQFLKWDDPVRPREPRIRLDLGGDSDAFYRDHILRLRKPASFARVSRANRRLWEALEFFRQRLRERFNGASAGEDLARLLSKNAAKGLVFTEMHVSGEDAAYAIFETLNARGAMLSSPDLLKNFLFATVGQERGEEGIRRLKRQWGGMLDHLGREDPTPFLRHLWHSVGNEVTAKKRLFRAMRTKIKGADAALAFMDEIGDGAETYSDMLSPSPHAWSKEQLPLLRALNICRASSHFALSLAAARRWGRGAEFTKLLRTCAALSFRRTTIGGQNPNQLERIYAETASAIVRGNADISQARENLRKGDVSDEFFTRAFEIYNAEGRRNLALHILLALERRAGAISHDPESPQVTVEHILPHEPGEGWDAFDRDIDRFIWRLGNLTLLSAGDNRKCGNLPFAEKREIYRDSEFAITRELAERSEWTPEALDYRQSEFAKLAKAIWRLE